jgi:hypothetical protein
LFQWHTTVLRDQYLCKFYTVVKVVLVNMIIFPFERCKEAHNSVFKGCAFLIINLEITYVPRSTSTSTGTDCRLTLTPTYLKMTFLLKVTVTLKKTTGETQAAETGPTLHNLDLLHL